MSTAAGTTSDSPCFHTEALSDSGFGAQVHFEAGLSLAQLLERLERTLDALPDALLAARGVLLLRGLDAITDDPNLLLRLSQLFGTEVENYRETQAASEKIHADVPQIFLVSNMPPTRQAPPARPDPPFEADGSLPLQFPRRRGWHTDQSYRRPPPDVSLFYAVIPAPPGQGQTLFADATTAYRTLPDDLRERIEGVKAIHVRPGTGRAEYAVRAGVTPEPLAANDQPQRQPLVRVHPVTGVPALYLCEAGQLDWVDGPIEGLSPGPDGEGAELVYALMRHITAPERVYAHEWRRGDLVVWDNRCTLHSATWFDADSVDRLMWRTTTWGNPGPEYAGEEKSWRP